jgi:hypothetical protein
MLKTTSIAAAAFGLGIGWLSLADASPEEEIARLDRVRQNLFEELVQTRREVASVRAELEAMTRARDQAETELARLKQQAASPKPEAQVRAAAPKRETMRPENTHPMRRASDAPALALPSVLQLQHP